MKFYYDTDKPKVHSVNQDAWAECTGTATEGAFKDKYLCKMEEDENGAQLDIVDALVGYFPAEIQSQMTDEPTIFPLTAWE